MVETFEIGRAIAELRAGKWVQRAGWNGKGMRLALHLPGPYNEMTEPYVYLWNAQGGTIPWNASQADLLASDWCVASDAEPVRK